MVRLTNSANVIQKAGSAAGREFHTMRLRFFLFAGWLLYLTNTETRAVTATLQLVASFPNQQVTGVAVSRTGRVFVNFPNWSDHHSISVAEIVNGQPVPFPNDEWNRPGTPKDHFVCVQSVDVDESDSLWILDPAAPMMKEIVKGGPKLVKVDLVKNEVVQIIPFGEDVAPKKSYLNDVRIDTKTQTAFITDSGLGAIVVVDLRTGKARRRLDNNPSTAPEKGFALQVNGKALLGDNGKPPQIASDGIAFDHLNGYLYYHALTAATLYRIKVGDLMSKRLTNKQLDTKVEKITETPAPDGMIMGPDGRLYLTDLEHSAIQAWDPKENRLGTVVADGRLSWPDSLSWGPDGSLYVTASQIQTMPRFNGGKDTHSTPYHLFKVVGVPATP